LIIVSNTSPIIYLATIGKLALLKELYQQIFIPVEVWNELMSPLILKHKKLPPDIKYEIEAKEAGWLIVKNPELKENLEIALGLTLELDIGEAYAIALSIELSADYLLINDQKAKAIAEAMGIKTRWITEILLEAAKAKLISDFAEFNEILNKIIDNGLWITKSHYMSVLSRGKKLLNK